MSHNIDNKVGIDDIAISVPHTYIDSGEFAKARSQNPEKIKKGLGTDTMAIPDSNQDVACFAANAFLKLIQRNHLRPQDIGRLYVATESSLDESKALNSYVIGMMEQVYGEGSFEHCGGIETKFACVSGSYTLYDCTNWIRAGESEGKYAVVIVTDIAKYDLGSSGEYTQGAGAVAVLLNQNPRLIAFDPRVTSTSIKNEYDFYRPFGKETPIVNGQYSNLLYMIQVRKAFESYKKRALETGLISLKEGETILDYIHYMIMHLPYSNMGKKALALLLRHEWRVLPRWKKIIEKTGIQEPVLKDPRGTIESMLADEEFIAKDKEFMDHFMNTEEFIESFNKVASSLIFSRMTGNLYTASLYLGTVSMLINEFKKGVPLEGKRIGFGSYGSGSSAMLFSGTILSTYKEVVERMATEEQIVFQRKLSLEEYEQLHKGKIPIEKPIFTSLAKGEFFLTEKKSTGERTYMFVE
jgi:hydroxymethylglutaryl-CoA synthase